MPKRSDARFCSNRCRQASHRRGKNPIIASAGVGKGRHGKTQVQMVSNVVGRLDTITMLASSSIDFPKAFAQPDAPLDQWDADITDAIRTLTQLRRGIRDQVERNASATVPAKDLRPGDWIRLGGDRVCVSEVLTELPEEAKESDSSCFARPDNVWLRTKDRESLIAVLADEEVPFDRTFS